MQFYEYLKMEIIREGVSGTLADKLLSGEWDGKRFNAMEKALQKTGEDSEALAYLRGCYRRYRKYVFFQTLARREMEALAEGKSIENMHDKAEK